MKGELFNTKKKREAAINAFTNLQNHPGWKLFEKILNANIEEATQIILSKETLDGEKATEREMDRFRDKRLAYKEARDTPKTMIRKLSSPEGEEPGLDPFQTEKELKAERKRRAGT